MSATGDYQSWPMILDDGDDLLVIWSRGDQHTFHTNRSMWATNGGRKAWPAGAMILNTDGEDDQSHGSGFDSAGRPLLWVIQRTGTGAGNTRMRLYRRDADTWSVIAEPTWTAFAPTHFNMICTVPGFGLIAHAQGTFDHGIVYSTDDGATWGQMVLPGSGVSTAFHMPVEGRFVVLDSGAIFGVARREDIDGYGNDPLWQMTCPAGADLTEPDNWTVAATSIVDQKKTPMAMVYTEGLLDGYYYDRHAGILRWVQVDPLSVWDNPTSWPNSTPLWEGSPEDNAGYPSAVRKDGANHVVWYSGTAAVCDIFYGVHYSRV